VKPPDPLEPALAPGWRCVRRSSRYNLYVDGEPQITHYLSLRQVSSPAVGGASPRGIVKQGLTMAFNPFHSFRKHRKVYFAILTIVCMFVFVLSSGIGGGGDVFDQVATWFGANRGRGKDVT